MRVTLPNGDWVDLADRLNYAQARRMNAAQGTPDAAGTVAAALITGWALRDVDDQAIDFPGAEADGIPLDALDKIPYDSFVLIAAAATEILPGQPDPKGTGERSPDSAPVSSNGSSRTLQMPTSSTGTRAGRGRISEQHRPT